jgi:hypothetical protein
MGSPDRSICRLSLPKCWVRWYSKGRAPAAGISADELPNVWLFQNRAGLFQSPQVFNRVLAKSGLAQRTPHYLRHTVVAVTTGGVVPQVRSETHSSIKMTCDTYGHLVPGGNRQAIDRLDDGNRMETFWTREHVSVPQVIEKIGATRRSRTGDLLITNQLLCRLS